MVGFFEVFAKIGYSSRYPCLNNGIFCYQVTDRIVEKFSFLYKLLLTFFFFVQILMPTFAPVKIIYYIGIPASLGYWLE